MEERQRIEKPVGIHQVDDRQHLAYICEDITVTQFDPLGVALGPAGEKHQRDVVWFNAVRSSAWQEPGAKCSTDSAPKGNARPDIFQVKNLHSCGLQRR